MARPPNYGLCTHTTNFRAFRKAEWVAYYYPVEFRRLRWDLKDYIQHQLDLFSGSYEYANHFSTAEYGEAESIDDDEMPLFRSTLRPGDREAPLDELDPLDVLDGLRAVIVHRISAGDLKIIPTALDLFNSTMEGGIGAADNSNPRSYIKLQTASEFVPWFIERLLESVERLKQPWLSDPYEDFVGHKFEPLKPMLDMLSLAVHQE